MDDDFQVPDVPEVGFDQEKKKKVRAGAGTSSTACPSAADGGASVTSAGSRLKLCSFQSCDCEIKSGRRHCHHHHRHLDNARNQVAKQKGPEAAKAWVEKCRDLEFANSQIEYMQRRAVGHGMFARAPLIDWVAWEQEFGVLVSNKTASQIRPFEEKEWILREVRKKGAG